MRQSGFTLPKNSCRRCLQALPGDPEVDRQRPQHPRALLLEDARGRLGAEHLLEQRMLAMKTVMATPTVLDRPADVLALIEEQVNAVRARTASKR